MTLIDPDGVIEREGLGVAAKSPSAIRDAVQKLLGDPDELNAASDRSRAYMAREYGEDKILAAYLETFEEVMRSPMVSNRVVARHA